MIRWKKGMFCMIAVCMGLTPMQALAASPEFAYTEEKWASLRDNKLEFDEIAELVHEYNTTVQQNELDYQDYRGKSSLKIAEEYYDSANEVSERISYPSDDDENYASQIARALSSEIQVDNLITQGDNNVDDGDIKRLGYDQAEAEIIKQAQSLMITYWSRMKSLESLKENVAQAESSYESVLIRKAAGMAVQSDEKEAEEAVTTAKASLQSAESSLEATKKSLCVLLGWKYSDEVEIGILPEPDLEAMEAIRENYPPSAFFSAMNFLGTHDTPRVLTLLGGRPLPENRENQSSFRLTPEERSLARQRLLLAAAVLFTFPGSPMIYYGDEAGMEGAADPFNRGPYPWGREDKELLAWYSALGRLRKERLSLRRGSIRYLAAQGPLLAYVRQVPGEATFLLVNAGGDALAYSLPEGTYRNLLTGESVPGGEIPLPPLGVRLLGRSGPEPECFT